MISNLDVLDVLKSASNVVQDERIIGDLRVDGVGYMEEGRISNLDVLEVLKSASNVVEDERVMGDLIVDGTIHGNNGVIDTITSENMITGNVVKCNRLIVEDTDGFEVKTTNKYDNLLTDSFVEIDLILIIWD